MDYFILVSVHLGLLAIITGTGLSAKFNWRRRNFFTSILGGLHCLIWCLAYAGLVFETFGGTL